MAVLSGIQFNPYSGWDTRPWGEPEYEGPAPEDLDAAARTARRVTESIGQRLPALSIASGRSGYAIRLDVGRTPNAELSLDFMDLPKSQRQWWLARLKVPIGFHALLPAQRADVLAEATGRALERLGAEERWDPRPAWAAVEAARSEGFRADWTGPWKWTRDRQRRARLSGAIWDDGYARWRIVVADRETEDPLLETEDVLGCTWLANLQKASKSMRFVGLRTLVATSGSAFRPAPVRIDIDSGQVQRARPDPVPTSYPGDPCSAGVASRLQVVH